MALHVLDSSVELPSECIEYEQSGRLLNVVSDYVAVVRCVKTTKETITGRAVPDFAPHNTHCAYLVGDNQGACAADSWRGEAVTIRTAYCSNLIPFIIVR